MGAKCPDYIANDRMAEEFILQIEIISNGINAETVENGVRFHLPTADITIFECDHCRIKQRCGRSAAQMEAA